MSIRMSTFECHLLACTHGLIATLPSLGAMNARFSNGQPAGRMAGATVEGEDSLSSASLVGAAQRCSDSDACSTLRAVKSARAALASYVIRIRTGQVSASRFVLCFRLASRSLSHRPLERRAKAG